MSHSLRLLWILTLAGLPTVHGMWEKGTHTLDPSLFLNRYQEIFFNKCREVYEKLYKQTEVEIVSPCCEGTKSDSISTALVSIQKDPKPLFKEIFREQAWLGKKEAIPIETYKTAFLEESVAIRKKIISQLLIRHNIKNARKTYLEYTVYGKPLAMLIIKSGEPGERTHPLLVATFSIRRTKKDELEYYQVYDYDIRKA